MSKREQIAKKPYECDSKEEIRAEIDRIDEQIIALLATRLKYVHAIVKFKQTAEDIVAQNRYDLVIETRRRWAAENGLSADVIEEMYRTLLNYGIDEEHNLAKKSIN